MTGTIVSPLAGKAMEQNPAYRPAASEIPQKEKALHLQRLDFLLFMQCYLSLKILSSKGLFSSTFSTIITIISIPLAYEVVVLGIIRPSKLV